MFFLKKKPKFTSDPTKLLGFKQDYNGLGVFLFKNKGGWTIVANHNKGMTKTQDPAKIATDKNSCAVSNFEQGKNLGIRVIVDGTTAEIQVKPSDDTSYTPCTQIKMAEKFQPYVLLSASNVGYEKKSK